MRRIVVATRGFDMACLICVSTARLAVLPTLSTVWEYYEIRVPERTSNNLLNIGVGHLAKTLRRRECHMAQTNEGKYHLF